MTMVMMMMVMMTMSSEDLDELRHTWEAMAALVGEGLVLHLGISGATRAVLQALSDVAVVKPAIAQVCFDCGGFIL